MKSGVGTEHEIQAYSGGRRPVHDWHLAADDHVEDLRHAEDPRDKPHFVDASRRLDYRPARLMTASKPSVALASVRAVITMRQRLA
jgi:hypothetical protein